jgi:hypothetical protein
MKKFLLSAASLLALSVASFAQSFTVQYGDTAVGSGNGSDVSIHNDISNTTSSDATYEWKIVSSSYPSGWSFAGVCDNNQCYTSNDVLNGAAKTTNTVGANSSMLFKAVFTESGTANGSQAWVRTNIYPTGDPFSARNVTFIMTKSSTTGVKTVVSDDDIVVFPNPARSSVNVVYDDNLGVKNIGVYNLIGKMVSIYKVNSTSAKLDVENLPSGIYFLRLFNAQGNVVATRKFTHQ